MYLVRRNNWNRPNAFPRLVDRFFEDFMNTPTYDADEDSVVWTPRVDVKESKDAYDVMADLPGLDKNDISISLHDNVLTLKGERKSEEKKENETSYYAERTYGSFSRSFQLPTKVDSDKINAEYKNGVLHLSIPKVEEAKPRNIQIK